jgi:hypothetical protein
MIMIVQGGPLSIQSHATNSHRAEVIDKALALAHISVMDRTTADLEDYRAAVSGLTIDELVAIGRAQIAAENAWQSRLNSGFANRMLDATMSRGVADLVDLQAAFARRLAAAAPSGPHRA